MILLSLLCRWEIKDNRVNLERKIKQKAGSIIKIPNDIKKDALMGGELEFSEGGKIPYTEPNTLFIDWQVGDIAEIGLNENTLVKATIIAYLLPLSTMVIAAILAAQVWSSDYLVALSSLIGLLLGGSLVRFHASVLGMRLLSKINLDKGSVSSSCYHALVVRKVHTKAVL